MDTAISRVVLITGYSSGIGRATALRLARAGWPVYATARRPAAIQDLADDCRALPLDVTDEASMQAAVAAVEGEAGAVGVLVNNAGYSQSGAVETVPLELVRRQFETNLFGAVRLTQLVLPRMRQQGWGRIVNISSIGGKLSFPGGAFYHGSKHALEAVSDVLRYELRPFGIQVVVVEPGFIRSGFAHAAVEGMDAVQRDGPYAGYNAAVAAATTEFYQRGLLARLAGDPDDVAAAVQRAISAPRPRPRYRVTASAPGCCCPCTGCSAIAPGTASCAAASPNPTPTANGWSARRSRHEQAQPLLGRTARTAFHSPRAPRRPAGAAASPCAPTSPSDAATRSRPRRSGSGSRPAATGSASPDSDRAHAWSRRAGQATDRRRPLVLRAPRPVGPRPHRRGRPAARRRCWVAGWLELVPDKVAAWDYATLRKVANDDA